MNYQQLGEWLHNMDFTAAMNVEYHQIMASWWAWTDACINVVVGVLGVIGIIASANRNKFKKSGLWVSGISMVLFVGLLAFPSGSTAREYQALFERWSSLRRQVQVLAERYKAVRPDEPLPPYFQQRVEDIAAEKGAIEQDEPAVNRDLLVKCFEDQVERLYGPGIRSWDDLEGIGVKIPRPEQFPLQPDA